MRLNLLYESIIVYHTPDFVIYCWQVVFSLNVNSTFWWGCKRHHFFPLRWVLIYLPVTSFVLCVHILIATGSTTYSHVWCEEVHLVARRTSFGSTCWYTLLHWSSGITLSVKFILAKSGESQIIQYFIQLLAKIITLQQLLIWHKATRIEYSVRMEITWTFNNK